MNLGERVRRDLKPDAQAFDEVRIFTVPRYKTSGLSGDEWRISATIEFYRNGILVHERGAGNVQWACVLAGAEYLRAQDDGKGYFAGEGDFCDQEGCKETATVTYRKKSNWCRDGHEEVLTDEVVLRKFCARHAKRGDCGCDDADSNYILVEGEPGEPKASDIRESAFGGVIEI